MTIRCAVALPVISGDGPHVSIRKQAPDAMTPVDLVERDSLSTELVVLLWQVYEYHGVVLFSGPTGVSLTTREHESDHKRVSMADLVTECNYLNPDVEVVAEINTPASFQTFAESLNTGRSTSLL